MKMTDIVDGRIVLEANEYGIACKSNFGGMYFGKFMFLDALMRALDLYNPMDKIFITSMISAGGIDKLMGLKEGVTTVDVTVLEKLMKGKNENDSN